jgi:hypothetical protein
MDKNQRFRYLIRWMNKTRYKDDKGKLIIKRGPVIESREKAEKDFQSYDTGYALQLVELDQTLCDCINFSDLSDHPKRWVTMKETPIRENDRWKNRMKVREIESIRTKIAYHEDTLKGLRDRLKVLEG